MSVQFMVSIMGNDRPGLMTLLANKTRALDGQWLSSRSVHLEGQFACLLKVEIPKTKVDTLKQQLSDLEGLTASYSDISEQTIQGKLVTLTFDSRDRQGITRDISHLLENHGIKVQQMDCHRVEVFSIGRSVFTANITLWLPDQEDLNLLTSALEELDEQAKVSVQAELA